MISLSVTDGRTVLSGSFDNTMRLWDIATGLPMLTLDAGFYVSTGVQGVLEVPLVARIEGRGGLGYQWNDYRTIAEGLDEPRADRILGWFAGLRRPVSRKLSLSASYRHEHRSSNLDRFDTDADGIYVQLEWDIFGAPRR